MATPDLNDLPAGVYYRPNMHVIINQIRQCDNETCVRKNAALIKERFLVSNEAERLLIREEAIPLLEQKLAGTADVAGLVNFGDKYLDVGELRLAFDYYARAVAINPLHATALSGLAEAHAKIFERNLPAAEINDKNSIANLKKEYYLPALENIFFAVEFGHPSETLETIKTTFCNAWVKKGWSLLLGVAGSEYSSVAVLCFDEVLKISDGKRAEGFYGKGYVLHRQGKHEDAKWHYQRAIQLHTLYDEAMGELANSLKSMGQYREALMYINKSLEINPDREYYWSIKGGILNGLKKSTKQHDLERKAHFEKALVYK